VHEKITKLFSQRSNFFFVPCLISNRETYPRPFKLGQVFDVLASDLDLDPGLLGHIQAMEREREREREKRERDMAKNR